MVKLIINGEKYRISLVETANGIDVCIDNGAPYICQITNTGKLKLYADVNKALQRTKNNGHYIITTKEMD